MPYAIGHETHAALSVEKAMLFVPCSTSLPQIPAKRSNVHNLGQFQTGRQNRALEVFQRVVLKLYDLFFRVDTALNLQLIFIEEGLLKESLPRPLPLFCLAVYLKTCIEQPLSTTEYWKISGTETFFRMQHTILYLAFKTQLGFKMERYHHLN